MTFQMMSFDGRAGEDEPTNSTRSDSGILSHIFPVAMATAPSVEPTPVANAPIPPYVQVWESVPIDDVAGRDECSIII
jgi:hypothetical protein